MPTFDFLINNNNEIHIFGEQYFSDYSRLVIQSIKSEIELKPKEYIINVNEDDYLNSIVDKYHIDPISFDFSKISVNEPVKREHKHSSGTYIYYKFLMTIPFEGDKLVLRMMPSQRSVIDFIVYTDYGNAVSQQKSIYVPIEVNGRNKDKFNQERDNAIFQIQANLENINKEVVEWNIGLKQLVMNLFKSYKDEYLLDNQFFESVNININESSDFLFNPNIIKKKIIPVPKVNKSNNKFTNSPSLDSSTYEDILNVINFVGKSLERKPSIYFEKQEEDLRDIILIFLETRYESTTGTGETFNKQGKTDILLKYIDGTNIFIAECGIWRGEKLLKEKIDQLFKYLTWRDSKSSLILFVKNKDFSKVIETVKQTVLTHPLFKSVQGIKDMTSLSYIFNFPEDSQKEVFIEIMLFHYPDLQ